VNVQDEWVSHPPTLMTRVTLGLSMAQVALSSKAEELPSQCQVRQAKILANHPQDHEHMTPSQSCYEFPPR